MAGFNPPLDQIAKDVETDVERLNEQAFRGIALQLFNLIVTETPVDKGTARGGWQPSLGAPNLAGGQANPVNSVTKLPPNFKLKPYYLSNPLPYIEVLEFGKYGKGEGATGKTGGTGFSLLAPRGMIRVNMMRLGLL